jgi:hypothetical protein
MNEHEQIIAIAEACGWTLCVFVESIGLVKGFPPPNNPTRYGTYENGMAQLPSYLTDLNAIHDVEKSLDQTLAGALAGEYSRMLTSIAWRSEQPVFAPMTATAAQRAEAFLRTIGKWTETNSMKEPTQL